jgi:hypothetical protein
MQFQVKRHAKSASEVRHAHLRATSRSTRGSERRLAPQPNPPHGAARGSEPAEAQRIRDFALTVTDEEVLAELQ